MSRPTPTIYWTKNWRAYNMRASAVATIWFDPETNWDAAPIKVKGGEI